MKKYAVCVYGYGNEENQGLKSVKAQYDDLMVAITHQVTLPNFKFPTFFEVWNTKKLEIVYRAQWYPNKQKWTER